jgi:hypothetical protein
MIKELSKQHVWNQKRKVTMTAHFYLSKVHQ